MRKLNFLQCNCFNKVLNRFGAIFFFQLVWSAQYSMINPFEYRNIKEDALEKKLLHIFLKRATRQTSEVLVIA